MERYGRHEKLGESMISLNTWYLGELSSLLEMLEIDEQQLIYESIIAAHHHELFQANYFGAPQVTRQKIVSLIEEFGACSEENGCISLDGHVVVSNLEWWLTHPSSMHYIVTRVASIVSKKHEPEVVCYMIKVMPENAQAVLGGIVRLAIDDEDR